MVIRVDGACYNVPMGSRIVAVAFMGAVFSALAHPVRAQLPHARHFPLTSLIEADQDARLLVGKFEDERRRRRDDVLAAWIRAAPAGAERVVVRCSGEPCPRDEKERILHRLAGMFGRMPLFLKDSTLKQVRWDDLPAGGRSDGMGKDGIISLFIAPEAPVERILVHELAHIYLEDRSADAGPFLALRFKTEAMQRKLAQLREHLDRTGGRIDDGARTLIREAGLPQRYPDDLHALSYDTGYWASAVELGFRAWRGDGDSYLIDNFSADEITWLLSKLGAHPLP